MSDADTAEAGEQGQNITEPNGGSFTPPASQEDLDRIIKKRLEQVHKRYSDYDDLKARAGKVDELESTIADLTGKVDDYQARDARAEVVSRVAKDKGVSADLLGRMTGDSEDDLAAQADVLKESFKVTGPVVKTAGESPDNQSVSPELEAARSLFGG